MENVFLYFVFIGDKFTFNDEIIGEGCQGKVYMGKENETGDQVAIKFINKSLLSERSLARLDTEVKILTNASHRNIVGFKHYLSEFTLPYNVDRTDSSWGVIVMDYCPYDMFDYLLVSGCFSEELSRTYFRQLLNGLQACHDCGVYHRDST